MFRTVPLSIIRRFSLYTQHVDFYSKNKFEKLVQLVGFIIRIYHDARSPERQTTNVLGFMSCTLITQIPSTYFAHSSCHHQGYTNKNKNMIMVFLSHSTFQNLIMFTENSQFKSKILMSLKYYSLLHGAESFFRS